MNFESLDQLALDFVNLVVSGKYGLASNMVAPSKKSEYSAVWIATEYEEMIEYGDGSPNHIEVMNKDTMSDWPSKEEDDLGWVYVAICGDGYSEAVAVIFSNLELPASIREIEWGRP